MGHQSDPSSSCCLCLRPHPPCVSDEQTAVDGAAQTRPALTDGASSSPAGEMDERHRLAGAGPWTAAVGRGGQGPGRRARARYCSHQFTCRSRQAPADRIPAAVVCRGHNMPAPHGLWHAHGAYTARLDAGAATTTRISRAGTTSPGERERRRERASTGEERTKPCRPRRRFRAGPLDESAAG